MTNFGYFGEILSRPAGASAGEGPKSRSWTDFGRFGWAEKRSLFVIFIFLKRCFFKHQVGLKVRFWGKKEPSLIGKGIPDHVGMRFLVILGTKRAHTKALRQPLLLEKNDQKWSFFHFFQDLSQILASSGVNEGFWERDSGS